MFRLISALLLMLAISLPGMVAAEEEYWEYTFRPGDSIWKIAEKYTTTVNNWGEIQRINKIRQGPDRKIQPGTRIVIPVSMLKQQPTPAIVIAVSGDVGLVRADGEKEKAIIGTKLYSGDRVLTEDKQNLRIQFADKSELQILPNSIVVLDKLSHHKQTGMVDTRIRLNSGSVNTWVEKQKPESRYQIKTPAAITAVRGTSFRLSTDSSLISRTEVTEGLVGVSAADTEKAVNEGYGIVAEKDKPLPEPVKLLPPPALSDNLYADRSKLHVAWADLEGAGYYRYQLASDVTFNQVVIDSSTKESTIKIEDLQPGNYFLRVRGVDQYKLEGIDSTSEFEILEKPAENDDYWKVIISTGALLILL